jgi:hypothetical protein
VAKLGPVRTCRGSRRLVARLAALAAVAVISGAAAPGVSADPQPTIVIGELPQGFSSLSSSFGDGSKTIQLNLQPSNAPLPQKLVIQIPAGYKLALTAAPGTGVAEASLVVIGFGTASLARGAGDVIARNPADFASDQSARACAPGVHGAVWRASVSIAGQSVAFTIFIDATPGGGYTLQTCPTGLAGDNSSSALVLSISGISDLASPVAPGRYVWHALVTPQTGAAYELQAVVPLPETVTIHGGYDPKRKAATLTGKVMEAGKPVANADVTLLATRGEDYFAEFHTRTKSDGSYSFRTRITRTTDFDVAVKGTAGACEGTTTAPGGCISSVSVPPQDAYGTVWVSIRGGAVRATRAADQNRAERENLTASDLGSGFQAFRAGSDSCMNQKHESDLTITGESTSSLLRYSSKGLAGALGLARVYATPRQARAAFEREAIPATARCELQEATAKLGAAHFGGLPGRVRAFHATADANGRLDLVFLQRGRSVAVLRFSFGAESTQFEHAAIVKVATRLH